MGLLNMIANAYRFDLIVVIPKMIADFNWFSDRISPGQQNLVNLSEFYDSQFLESFLTNIGVRFIHNCPAYEKVLNDPHHSRMKRFLTKVGNNTPAIVRFSCLHKTFLWDNTLFGRLRSDLEAALIPISSIDNYVQMALRILGPNFIAIHARVEGDWKDYCKLETTNIFVSKVAHFDDCFIDSQHIADWLVIKGIAKTEKIFIASEKSSKVRSSLQSAGFQNVVTRTDLIGQLNFGREILALIDFHICAASVLFIGNIYSSFSYEVKALRNLNGGISQYINFARARGNFTEDEIESARWDVSLRFSNCTLLARVPTLLKPPGIVFLNSTAISIIFSLSGYVHLSYEVWTINMVEFSFDDKSIYLRLPVKNLKCSNVTFQCLFDLWVPIRLASPFSTINVYARLHNGGRIELAQSPVIIPRFSQDDLKPIIFIYYPNDKHQSGGPEALHQLHNAINAVGFRSLYYKGNKFYSNQYTKFVDKFEVTLLGSRDVIIFPELVEFVDSNMPLFISKLRARGVRLMSYYLGQHLPYMDSADAIVRFSQSHRYLIPLCLSDHFKYLYWCSENAVLSTPMADSFYVDSKNVSLKEKQDIVLFDWGGADEERSHFNPSMLSLNNGTKLVQLIGMQREDIKKMYRKAKVIFDTYSTGMERVMYESSLYDVFVIPPASGPANNFATYPIPPEYKWELWNISQLSKTINYAISQYPSSLESMSTFKSYVTGMREAFSRQVYTFSSSNGILFRTVAITRHDMKNSIRMAISCLNFYPLSRIEILVESVPYFNFEFMPILRELHLHGYEDSIVIVQLDSEYVRLGQISSLFYPFSASTAQSSILVALPPCSIVIGSDVSLLRHQLSSYSKEFLVSDNIFFGNLDIILSELHNHQGYSSFLDTVVKNNLLSFDKVAYYFLRSLHSPSENILVNGFLKYAIIFSINSASLDTLQCSKLTSTLSSTLMKYMLPILGKESAPNLCNRQIKNVTNYYNQDISLVGFYHIKPQNLWLETVTEQLQTMIDYLYLGSKLHNLFVRVDSSNEEIRSNITSEIETVLSTKLSQSIADKWQYLPVSTTETDTGVFGFMHKFCNSHRHSIVFYFENEFDDSNRRFQAHFIYGKYSHACINSLLSGSFDVCRVEYVSEFMVTSSFWWATCAILAGTYFVPGKTSFRYDVRERILWRAHSDDKILHFEDILDTLMPT